MCFHSISLNPPKRALSLSLSLSLPPPSFCASNPILFNFFSFPYYQLLNYCPNFTPWVNNAKYTIFFSQRSFLFLLFSLVLLFPARSAARYASLGRIVPLLGGFFSAPKRCCSGLRHRTNERLHPSTLVLRLSCTPNVPRLAVPLRCEWGERGWGLGMGGTLNMYGQCALARSLYVCMSAARKLVVFLSWCKRFKSPFFLFFFPL